MQRFEMVRSLGGRPRGAGRRLVTATKSFIGHGFLCRNRNRGDHSQSAFFALDRRPGSSLHGGKTGTLAPVFEGFYFSRMGEVPYFCLLQ